ncbi:MAG: hypothetical protein HC799_14255 [Limnothrix sp. RL_2_0]|nr:hypothetical protein [Limnothrix sp. RL_2_0]
MDATDSPLTLLPGSVGAILAEASESKCLTKADRYGLMAAIFDERLPEEERQAVNRLLYGVLRGRIKVID